MAVQIIKFPKVENRKGNLAVIENDIIPFEIKRVYYLYDVPSTSRRGGHAHKNLTQVLIAISGSFDVILKDGKNKQTINLNKPDRGLLITKNTWRELENFSSGAVCLVVASAVYNESDYIRNYADFLKYINQL